MTSTASTYYFRVNVNGVIYGTGGIVWTAKIGKKNSKNLVEVVLNRIFYGGNGFSTIKNF